MRSLLDQRSVLDRQIANEARSILTGLQQEADRAKQEVAQFSQLLSTQKLESGTAQQNEVELRALEREARAERELLETLLAQYRTLLAREGSGGQPAEARMIETADAPLEPSGPRLMILVAAATLAALLLSIGFVVLRELLSGRALGIHQGVGEVTAQPDGRRNRYEDRKEDSRPLAA